ncbi:MAG: Asp-tRNA(Asn)/Glu-tRNA(Gln) amidotransferase subunit GatA [Lachnospiraceae bacterium]|nr:Asp-tRNA(Asn)/Glu-tRNA(Gln) amidotransferase subunit GatA [Lachnospiraceae bacterium]
MSFGSLRELAGRIAAGEISAREAAEDCLRRMKELEPSLHCMVTFCEEEALAQADEVQRRIRAGEAAGPLAGVPVVVKDNLCTAGVRTTCGSRMLADFVPPYEAEAVRRLRDAGAVILGKSNLDEFAMGSTTETSAEGATRNPWETGHVPGGSSGGSCAAVAAGEAFAALGSDTGGSIRQPAAFCGVVGLKPTYGTVSRFGLVAYASSMDQVGPVARSVEDCAAVLEAIAGKDEKDTTSVERDNRYICKISEDIRGMKIGVPAEFLGEGTQAEVREAVLAAAEVFRSLGAEVEEFSLPLVAASVPAYYILACAEASSNLARFDGVKYGYRTPSYQTLEEMVRRSRSEGFGPEAKRRILLGTFVLSEGYYEAYYRKAMKARERIRQAYADALARYDVLLTPAAPGTAPKIGESLADPLRMYQSDVCSVGVNLAGLPALSVPCGLDRAGLPIGLQLIGGAFREDRILSAGAAYERARGAFPTPALKGGAPA